MKYLKGIVIISILYFSFSTQNTRNSQIDQKVKSDDQMSKNTTHLKEIAKNSDNINTNENTFLQLTQTKSKKGNRKTRVLKKVKMGKYTLIILSNSDLSGKKKNLKKHVSYSKCNKKTGFLTYVQNRPNTSRKGKGKGEITVYPIYISLNQNTFSLFYSYDPSTLFKIVKLDSIQRVAIQYEKTFCFDIIINEIINKKLRTGPLSLCANSLNQMKNWIRAILEFKECKIKKVTSQSRVPHQGRTLIDFNNINKLIKKNIKKTTSVSQIAYDSNDTVHKESLNKIKEREIIAKQIKKIIHTIHMTKIAKNQLRRKMVSQLRKTRGKFKGAFRTENFLHSILLKRTYAEKEQYSNMISLLTTKRTSKMLKSISEKINKLSMKELTEYKNSLSTQIALEEQQAKNRSRKLLVKIMRQKKVTDYSVCYRKNLYISSSIIIEFKDVPYATKLCKLYFGEFGLHTCLHKENFCQMCCSYHIADNFIKKKMKCVNKCNKNIFPKINWKTKLNKKNKGKGGKKIPKRTNKKISNKPNKVISNKSNKLMSNNPNPLISDRTVHLMSNNPNQFTSNRDHESSLSSESQPSSLRGAKSPPSSENKSSLSRERRQVMETK